MEKPDKNDPHYAYNAASFYKIFVRKAYTGSGQGKPDISISEMMNIIIDERKLKPGEFVNKTMLEFVKNNMKSSFGVILKKNIPETKRKQFIVLSNQLKTANTSDQIMQIMYNGMELMETD